MQLFIGRIHVRRTDKVGAEAAFHSIDEYMTHVEDYYETLEKHRHIDQRRVYIATDDPSVINDAKRKCVLVFNPPVQPAGWAGYLRSCGLSLHLCIAGVSACMCPSIVAVHTVT